MGTKERLNILKLKLDDEMKIKCRVFKDEDIKKEGNIWYIPGQDGSVKAVKVEPMKTKKDVITELLKRVSNLEFAIEKLEKNEQYKYINGQAYFRQDYVLDREKEIDRLKAELELYKDNQDHLNNLLEKKNNIIEEVRNMLEEYEKENMGTWIPCIIDTVKDILKDSDKE
jgi:hypothetical protein